MTLREILKNKNIEESVVDEILEDMKKNNVFLASEENLDVRYSKLKGEHEALVKKDSESQSLIQELQNATKGQEDIQSKIVEYESKIEEQEKLLKKERVNSALKFGLVELGAKSTDVDYLIYKLNNSETDWNPELDENGKVKGLNDKIENLKTQYPNQFQSSTQKKIDEKKIEKGAELELTKEDFNKMGYQQRNKLYNENPELYNELAH